MRPLTGIPQVRHGVARQQQGNETHAPNGQCGCHRRRARSDVATRLDGQKIAGAGIGTNTVACNQHERRGAGDRWSAGNQAACGGNRQARRQSGGTELGRGHTAGADPETVWRTDLAGRWRTTGNGGRAVDRWSGAKTLGSRVSVAKIPCGSSTFCVPVQGVGCSAIADSRCGITARRGKTQSQRKPGPGQNFFRKVHDSAPQRGSSCLYANA